MGLSNTHVLQWSLCILLLFSSSGGYGGSREEGGQGAAAPFAFAQSTSSPGEDSSGGSSPAVAAEASNATPESEPPILVPTSQWTPQTPPSSASRSQSPSATGSSKSVGVNIGFGLSTQQLDATQTVAILQRIKATSVKLFGDYNDTLAEVGAFFTAIAGTGIDVVISTSNDQVALFAANANNETEDFVQSKIVSRPDVKISAIVVGNNLLSQGDTTLATSLIPAMNNLQLALVAAGLSETVKLVTPIGLDVLTGGYNPPSSGAFSESSLPVITPLLEFLNSTGSSFMVDAFPFFAAKDPAQGVDLSFALGAAEAAPLVDSALTYTNAMDMMVDAVAYAIGKQGFSMVPISIGSTGWPTQGDAIATVANAEKFNKNLVGNLVSGRGTPRLPGVSMQAYIFELLDEDNKTLGPSETDLFERHWGIFDLVGTAKYEIDLSSPMVAASPSDATPTPPTTPVDSTAQPSAPSTLIIPPPVDSTTPPANPSAESGPMFVPPTDPSAPSVVPVDPSALISTPPADPSAPALVPADPSVPVTPPATPSAPAVVPVVGSSSLIGTPLANPSAPALVPADPSAPTTPPATPSAASNATTPPTIDPSCVPGGNGGSAASVNPAIAQTGGAGTYCVANDCAAERVLLDGLNWVCETMDCSPINPGGTCFEPNTTLAHASWAFNLKYVSALRDKGQCYFGGSGLIVDVNPSVGTCTYG